LTKEITTKGLNRNSWDIRAAYEWTTVPPLIAGGESGGKGRADTGESRIAEIIWLEPKKKKGGRRPQKKTIGD